MNQASSKRYWPALWALALGIVAVMLWWLESAPRPETPAQRPIGEERSRTRLDSAVEKSTGVAPALSPVAAVEQARSLQLTAGQAQRVAEWIRQLDAAADVTARDEVLEDARSHEDTEVIVELVLHQLDRAGPEERIEALEKLVGNRGASQIKAFVRGLDDADPQVREASLQFVRDQEAEVRIPVFEYGLGSADASVRSDSFLELTRENVKAAIPALMRALKLDDPGIRQQASEQLSMRLADTRKEPFTDASEALGWWESNGRRYDERMYRVD